MRAFFGRACYSGRKMVCAFFELCDFLTVKLSARLGLTLNANKTQLLAINCKTTETVRVRYDQVVPSKDLSFLGFTINNKGCMEPHRDYLSTALSKVAGLLTLMRGSMPPHVLCLFAQGLAAGRACPGAASTFRLRLFDADPCPGGNHQVQRAMNRVARATAGTRLTDKVRTTDLLHRTRLPSINQMACQEAAVLVWSAMHVNSPSPTSSNH